MAERVFIGETDCDRCKIKAKWHGTDHGGQLDMSCTDHETDQVCPHWEEHHEALALATMQQAGRAEATPVIAQISWLS